ncbi:MAG: hypothetical protein Q9218_005450 [Villophora microphyllina]
MLQTAVASGGEPQQPSRINNNDIVKASSKLHDIIEPFRKERLGLGYTMQPFRPVVPQFFRCLRPSTCFRPRASATSRLNPQSTRKYSSERSGPPRSLIPVLLLATASGGILWYSSTAHSEPLNLEDPAPSSSSLTDPLLTPKPSRPSINPLPPSNNPLSSSVNPTSPSTNSVSTVISPSAPITKPSSPSTRPSVPLDVSEDSTDDLVPTGTSTIPFFPRTICLPTSPNASTSPSTSTATPTLPYGTGPPPDQQGEEYQLLGLGIRKVSFLRIQVYVVGLYVTKSSLPALQESLVRAFFTSSAAGDSTVSSASTLVENEKTELRSLLVEGGKGGRGEKIWDEVLQGGRVKSVLRIVPTRQTDFGHMREGWVRSINARAGPTQQGGVLPENKREGLEGSVTEFKSIFGGGRKGVAKGKVLLLQRDEAGALGVWVENENESVNKEAVEQKKGERENKREMQWLGGMEDERISRLVWLGYLAGGNVASEEARKNVVDGVMEIVERPIGTIDSQVV